MQLTRYELGALVTFLFTTMNMKNQKNRETKSIIKASVKNCMNPAHSFYTKKRQIAILNFSLMRYITFNWVVKSRIPNLTFCNLLYLKAELPYKNKKRPPDFSPLRGFSPSSLLLNIIYINYALSGLN